MDGVHVAPTSKDDNYVIYSGNKYQDSQHDKHLSNNTINGWRNKKVVQVGYLFWSMNETKNQYIVESTESDLNLTQQQLTGFSVTATSITS